MINDAIAAAYSILDGATLDRDRAMALGSLQGTDILDLLSLANKVRHRFAPQDHVCTIMNAQSGACEQNCRFCAQSAHHAAEIDVYSLTDPAEMVRRARTAYDSGVRSFGVVTSGYGFTRREDRFDRALEGIDAIRSAFPDMSVCASLGILSDETAAALARHGVAHYNINLQTNPRRYAELIATTHDVGERVATMRFLKAHGIKVCSGGIIGLGETMEDRIELAFTLRDLDADVIPLNVLVPIEGTPLAGQPDVPAAEVAKTFAIFRLVHPMKTIKFAAGRETKMNDFQGLLMLAGANGFLTGGYLTTRGRDVETDRRFREALSGFGGSPV
jgi:biotin synthase